MVPGGAQKTRSSPPRDCARHPSPVAQAALHSHKCSRPKSLSRRRLSVCSAANRSSAYGNVSSPDNGRVATRCGGGRAGGAWATGRELWHPRRRSSTPQQPGIKPIMHVTDSKRLQAAVCRHPCNADSKRLQALSRATGLCLRRHEAHNAFNGLIAAVALYPVQPLPALRHPGTKRLAIRPSTRGPRHKPR